jgi:hypothetical protein
MISLLFIVPMILDSVDYPWYVVLYIILLEFDSVRE